MTKERITEELERSSYRRKKTQISQ